MSSLSLETELREAGIKLLALASCVTTQVQEFLHILDELEVLLSKVEQAPTRPMQDALYPSMKALISNQLLKHTDIDVKVSVASCMSELIRITAPDAPYDDVQMKDIFQLTVMALGKLSSDGTRGYSKALRILDNIVKVKACLLMLDLECDGLIADMFQQFLSTIRYIPLPVVFRQMEYIMTLTLEESEEISEEFLSSLLTSVSKKKENVSSRSWRLGETVLRNCAVKLQRFLPKVVRSRNLSFNDYSIVVASICQNSPEDEQAAAGTDPSATKPSEIIVDDGTDQKMTNGTLEGGNSLRTLEHCHLVKQQGNTEARRHSQAENSIVTGAVQIKTATVPKKRGRKPKSQQKSEEDSGIPHDISVFGEKLVGRRVKVWWPLDKLFYEGAVASFDSLTQTHKVLYADGDEETLNLRNERWELLEEPTMEHSSPAATSHKSLKKKAKTKSASSAKQQGSTHSSSKWFADKPKTEAPKSGSVDNDSAPNATTDDSKVYATCEDDKQKSSNETEAPKSGSADNDSAPNATTDDSKVYATYDDDKQKSGNETEAPKSGSAGNDSAPNATTDDSKVYATFEDDKQKSSKETDDSKPDVLGIVDVANDSISLNPNIVDANHKFNSEEETKTPTIIRNLKPCSIVERVGESAVHTKITEDDKLPREKPSGDGMMVLSPDPVDVQGSNLV